MILSKKKTKVIIFNFTQNFQFSTHFQLQNTNVEIVNQTKIHWTIITDDSKWDVNCSYLIIKFYGRMQLLQKVAGFEADINHLRQIYITFCRPIL